MSLELYCHPLASYCWKALIALYENGTPFTARHIDLGDPEQRAELAALWPFTKFPVLRDIENDRTIPESSILIEYLDRHHPSANVRLVPSDPDAALAVRRQDRFFDVYIHESMQKVVGDRLRPDGQHDPFGVTHARQTLDTAYDVLERELTKHAWAASDAFTMADCAAAPALYYANLVHPFGAARPNVTAYLARLERRPSFARVLEEAAPYFHMFPGG